MTVALDSAMASPETGTPPDWRPAGWWARAGAFAIDVLAGIGAATTALLTGWSAPTRGLLWWVCMVVAAVTVVGVAANRLLLPAATGWSLGRAVFGIEVVDRDGHPPGSARLALRDLAHLLDTVPLFLGWLWPLIDRRGRTFADLLAGTEVRVKPGPHPDRRFLAVRVMAAAAALSVALAGLGYVLVYRHQRAVDSAREQIAVQGPKIVVDILSYTAATVADDFAKAQNLVTDGYRPELATQQDAVRKNPVDNEYWVSNSAVLSSDADRASMLMLLQGQRGAPPNPRFVTASVRADFDRTGSAEWKLSKLTVLSAPKPAPEGGKPTGEATKPSGESPKPSGESLKPSGESPKPSGESPKPTGETPKPTGEAPRPAGEAPKPSGAGR